MLLKKKRYNSFVEIFGSPEYATFLKKKETTGFSLLDKIVAKKGLKVKQSIDLSTSIMDNITEFFNSVENEIDE